MAFDNKQLDELRALKGVGMTSAVGEYTPPEFWEALDQIATLQRQLDRAVKLLKELVACKDLKAMLEYDRLDFNEREFAESDYNMRKPAAWNQVRAFLAELDKEKNGD